ncbi:uncharacterized protein GGS22DRAFT_169759 [Annulohypoxylon maeteangense]|uniref:uncharacterized protein n=1 Tax=Annulohypoxylon maeteangense TaxID=1927788 RepID=UPI0020078A72|nr:uncharacterized protein GGS22DRAFT_169759 [Annulohypoxylon maeteangense]KAI0882564.1 hypothetical protein GGS22DRAFT_169759 [Annulohypoxylon maeteangense]
MDPFTAIGLAGNIISFLDFGYKLISATKDIHASASGSSVYNDDLSLTVQQLQQLVANLKLTKPPGSFSEQELSLLRVSSDCEHVSVELASLLDKLKAQNSKSMRGAFRAAMRNWRNKDEKAELVSKLDRCRQQLNLELTSLSRSESLERLNKLIDHGQANEYELRSLIKNVESLRSGTNVSCLDSKALGQIRSLLQLTDDAILNVRRARVLDALRFEHMNERFEDIEEAYEKTFGWIFADEVDGTCDIRRSPDSVNEYDDDQTQTSQSLNEDSEAKSTVSGSVASGLVYTSDSSSTTDNRILRGNSKHFSQPVMDDNSSFEWILDDLSSIENDRSSLLSDGESTHSEFSLQRQQRETSLAFSDIDVPNSVRENLSEARDRFISWLQYDSGIFYISGKPGSGKSTLMKYITRHPKTKDYLGAWAGEKRLILGDFFFWRPGSSLQKSLKGLTRGLLYRLLSECHDLIPFVFPTQWESSVNRENVHIEYHECHQAFERLIAASKSHGEYRFALFVDGLDEFEGNHAALIRQLLAWSNENPNVKICVSSREWAIFRDAFGGCPKFRLHDLTSADIQLFVGSRFREMRASALVNSDGCGVPPGISSTKDLEEMILDESDGVFLWVAIVLRHVEDGLANGDQLKDLLRLIKSLPTDLEPMFQQLLDSIPRNNRRLAYSMLYLVHFCRPLEYSTPLMQFSFLEEYTEDRDFALDSRVSLLTTKERDERLLRSKRRIYGLCKGLLELRPNGDPHNISQALGSAVRLIHRSISEFLESQEFKQKMDLNLPDFDPIDAYCHTYLGLLQRVRLPASYYVSRTRSPYSEFEIIPDCPFSYIDIFDYSIDPSLKQGLKLIIMRHIISGRQASSRFHKLLDAIHKTVIDLKMNSEDYECALIVRLSDVAVRCHPKDLVIIACAQMGLYEYFISNQSISPELMSCCASVALLSHIYAHDPIMKARNAVLKTLAALFNHGASPDSNIIPGRESAFHMMLQEWCYFHSPSLTIIAFMLYHGANPRFALTIGKTKYTFPRDVERIIFKAYFTSEQFLTDTGHETKTKTIRVLRKRERHYAIYAAPYIVDTIKQHGHVLDLRTLVSLWFPQENAVLQEVIDWILALGGPVQAHHRKQLQDRFDATLRPFFDPDHPSSVKYKREGLDGCFPGSSEKLKSAIFSIPTAEFSKLKRYVEEPRTTGGEVGTLSTAR